MTVKELIKELQQIDPERLVVVASDPEGNSFDTLESWSTAAYDKEAREVGLEKLTEEDIKAGYGEEDVKDGVPCIVIWP
jgi:hypothetical protein